MNRFRAVFSSRHVVLPVIHVASQEQALRNVRTARDGGADGAFLISHGRVSDDELLAIHQAVVAQMDSWWVGVNCLSFCVEEAFRRMGDRVAGVWIDDALIDERRDDQPEAARIAQVQREVGWRGLYFGGVAFKYQRPVRDLARVARLAAPWLDVVTTSGPGTGEAADPDKIRVMKEAIGDHPLAIASGVTPENVTDYLPYADCFLAATGVSYTFEELDPARVRAMVRVVRAWRGKWPQRKANG
jgi:predicted TIM-barrel enzyme